MGPIPGEAGGAPCRGAAYTHPGSLIPVPLCEQHCGGGTPISQQTGRREPGGSPSALWKRAPTTTVGTWQ